MKVKTLLLLASLSLLACSDGKDSALERNTLTRQQKDSVVANSKLPGAKAVQGAMNAAAADAARQQAADTIH